MSQEYKNRNRNNRKSGNNSGRRGRSGGYQKRNNHSSNQETKAHLNEYKDVEDESKLEGRNSVEEAIAAGREFNKVWYLKPQDNKSMDSRLASIIQDLKQTDAVMYPVDRKVLDRMAVTHSHQGIIAQVASHEYAEVSDIFALAEERGEEPFILLLDQIQDSQNLGAILRTADAAGVHGVIIPRRRSVSLDAVAAKTSVGAIEHVLVARVTNLNQCISELKDQGVWIGGLDVPGENIFSSDKLTNSLALVVGNEGDGITNNVKKSCDFLLEIPMRGEINSLNASNAAAVAMYAVLNKRM